jgi:hypothetical protein
VFDRIHLLASQVALPSVLTRRQVVLVAVACVAVARSGARSQDQGFPPLAGLKISIHNQIDIDHTMATLREIGKFERLAISEGRFPKQGRDVMQIKLERDPQTFFYMDNFSDANSFELTAYSHVSKDVWHPIWKRLIEKLTEKVGSQKLSDVYEY